MSEEATEEVTKEEAIREINGALDQLRSIAEYQAAQRLRAMPEIQEELAEPIPDRLARAEAKLARLRGQAKEIQDDGLVLNDEGQNWLRGQEREVRWAYEEHINGLRSVLEEIVSPIIDAEYRALADLYEEGQLLAILVQDLITDKTMIESIEEE